MATPQMTPITQEGSTPYDEFNMVIPRETFPDSGVTAVSGKVRERGWVLSAYAMPPDAQEVNSLRVVVRPHLNLTVMETLANDIIAACQYLEKNGGTAAPPQLHGPHQSAPKC